jgi:GT2 family glycosyltransferase
MKLVSVIIPTHNRVRLLKASLESVLRQTHTSIEVIVVDDAGTEDVQALLTQYDGNIRYIRNEKNLGLAGTRNQGIAAASGDYIAFLDDDDLLEPTKIEKQVAILESNPEVDVVYCGYYYLFEDEKPIYPNVTLPEGEILKDLLLGCPILAHAPLIRPSCFERWGVFDATLRVCEDWELWQRFALHGCRFACVHEALCAYRQHGGNMTAKIEVWSKGHLVVLDRAFSMPGLPADIMALKPAAYASSRITVACAYFREGEFERGGSVLKEIMPEIAREGLTFNHLVAGLAHAILTARDLNDQLFLQSAGEQIFPKSFSHKVCARTRAIVEFERAHQAYELHRRRAVMQHGVIALSNNFMGFMRNRGFHAMMLKAMLSIY